MTDASAVSRKLGVKPNSRAIVLNPPDGALGAFEPLPDGVTVETRSGADPADVVVLFAQDAAEVDEWLSAALGACTTRGLLWVCYPKGGKKAGTDLNRDILWRQLGEQGLTGVTLVAFDGTWSAMRFRPADEVGAR